jgi:branched-chain amino acid transport system substrate-binding protein
MGIVGPWESGTAAAMLPVAERQQLVIISPGATLTSLTVPGTGGPDGLTYSELHPMGTSPSFFRLVAPDTADGAAAAALAVASTNAHGLAAHSIFVVNDGSPSGKAQAAAFTSALTAAGGASAGTATVAPDAATGTTAISAAQAAAIDIIRADPDAVFYAGGTEAGADLRGALSLTGAPQLTILTTGAIADNPGWSADVGQPAAAAYTLALLPTQVPAEASSTGFASAYRTAFGDTTPPPQAALAYDAAMDEIAAIKAMIAAGKPITRDAVRAQVASAAYVGITGTLAFDAHGDLKKSPGFSLFACDASGAWSMVTDLLS